MEDHNSSANSSSQSSANSNSSLITGVAVFAFIAILSVGVVMYQRRPTATVEATPSPQVQTAASSSPTSSTGPAMMGTDTTGTTPAIAEDLKDGTYTAEGDYVSPGGPEHVGVTVTLKDGKITDAIFEPKATLPVSVNFQGQFKDGFKSLVVGKNIAEVKLDKVSGSSLTPKGFNDALQKIIVQAQS